MSDTQNTPRFRTLGAGLVLGLAFGVVLGMVFDNIAFGIAVGPVIGLAIAMGVDQARKRGTEDSASDGDER